MQPQGGRLLAVAGFVAVLWPSSGRTQPAPSLGSAASFAVLGGTVSSSGASQVTGNLGVSHGTLSGSTSISLGDKHENDVLARAAQNDAAIAYHGLSVRNCDRPLTAGPLTAGIYRASTPLQLDGTLLFDAQGNRDAVWIVQVPGNLTTAPASSVVVIHGGQSGNVFWQVAGSATLGADATFSGNLLAAGNLTLDHGARLSGRALTTGAVALDANRVSLCCSLITVSAPALSPGTVGWVTFTAAGGVGPYTFSAPPGQLPPGLTLSMAGRLSGTPAAGGSYTFPVTAVDSTGCPGAELFTFEIAGPNVDPQAAPALSTSAMAVLTLLLAVAALAVIRRGGVA